MLTIRSYARAPEDENYYNLIASGVLGGTVDARQTYLDLTWPGPRANEIGATDVVVVGGSKTFVLPDSVGAANVSAEQTRLTGLGSSVTFSAGANEPIAIYRHKYAHDATVESYWVRRLAFPYRFAGRVGEAGNGYIDLAAKNGEILASLRTATVAADTLIVQGQAPLVLSGATIAASGESLRILKGGTDFTGQSGKAFAVFGAHAYENGDPHGGVHSDLAWLQTN